MPAPTLLKLLTIAPALGAAAVAGHVPDYDVVSAKPAPAAITVPAGLFPTVVIVAGPYAAPERALPTMDGRVPFLQRVRIVYPLLPDSPDVADGGLAPTILLGSSDFAGVPGPAEIDVMGLQPMLFTDGAFRVEVAAQYPWLSAAGLAPTVVVAAINETIKAPRAGLAEMLGRAPELLTILQQEVGVGALTASGIAPAQIELHYDWQTVALTGAAVWTDVPPAD